MNGKMTTRQKLDEALGISGEMSVDEMLKDLDTQTVSISDKLGGMETAIRESAAKIDEKALELERGETNGVLAISDMNASLREIEGLIGQSKQVFQHMVDNITSSDLLDSELIQAAASFLEALHQNIGEFMSIFKAKQKFVEKIKLMIFNQEQKKEILEIKHRQNLELIAAKAKAAEKGDPEAIDISGGWNTDQVIKDMASGEIDVRFSKEDDSTGIVKSAEFDPMEAIEREDEENEDDEEDEDGKKKRRKQD